MNKRFLTVITIVSLVGYWIMMGSCKVSGATGGGLSGTPLSPFSPSGIQTSKQIPVVIASTGVSNFTSAATYIATPNSSTTNTYPLVVQLMTNQSFIIQDEKGENLFGIRHDSYPVNASRHWEVNFGSKNQGLVDQLWDIGGGADIAWRINGDINQAFFYNSSTTPKGIEYRYCNTNYFAAGTTSLLLANSYGEVHAVCLFGDFITQSQTATPGVAAGTGGSLAGSIDNNASDLSAQITLVTGNAGVTTGTLVTYTLENAAAVMDSSITSVPVKPVFSAANAAAANEIAKFYCTGTGTSVIISARAAPTANTTYVFNIFICR